MPCRYDDNGEEEQRLRQDLDISTRLACKYCRSLIKRGKAIPPWAAAWWREHEVADRAREKQEAEDRTRKKERLYILESLTPAQRDYLELEGEYKKLKKDVGH